MSHVEYSNNFSMEFGFMGTVSKHHFLENISHLYLARQLYKKITWDYMFVFALELGRVWFWAKNFFLFTVPFLLFMQGGHKRQPSWTSLALICYRYYLIMNKSKSFFCSNLYAPYPFHVNFNHRSKYRSSVNPTCFKLQFYVLKLGSRFDDLDHGAISGCSLCILIENPHLDLEEMLRLSACNVVRAHDQISK